MGITGLRRGASGALVVPLLLLGAAEPAAFPADGRYAPPPQYRR